MSGPPRGTITPMADPCQGPECPNDAEREGLCSAHRKQKYKGRELTPLRAYGQDPWERVFEAFVALLEADDEDEAEFEARRKEARRVLRNSQLLAKPRLPKTTVAAIRAARGNGETLQAVAMRFGVAPNTVRNVSRDVQSAKVPGDEHA